MLGPAYDVTKIEEEKLLKYNFLKIVDNQEKYDIMGHLVGSTYQGKSYTCFSDFILPIIAKDLRYIDFYYPPNGFFRISPQWPIINVRLKVSFPPISKVRPAADTFISVIHEKTFCR